jgi:hypothetical protein
MENRSLEDRGWSKVDIRGYDECWNWTGAIDTPGYGAFNYNGKKKNSHVVAYILTYGSVPDGKIVCHTCSHNRPCCNPNHLYAGTHSDNMLDAIKDGRIFAHNTGRSGSENINAKLSEEDVREIRALRDNGTPYKDIARRYGIHERHAKAIVRREKWKTVL